MVSIEKFCIFCLQIPIENDFEMLKDVGRQVLDMFVPKLNFESTKSLICQTCLKKLLAAFQFKSTCLSSDDVIFPYVVRSEASQVDLKEIYMQINKNETKLENIGVCRLCMQLATGQVMPLGDLESDILKEFLPEMNFSVTRDPVVCKGCYDSIHSHTEFLRHCFNVEIKVDNQTVKDESDALPENFCRKTEDNKTEVIMQIKNEEIEMKVDNQTVKEESDASPRDCCMKTGGIKIEIEYDPIIRIKSERECYKEELNGNSACHEIKRENPSDISWFQCNHCHFKSKYRYHVSRHQLVHKDLSEVRVFKCNVCEFTTKHAGSLKYHKSRHDKSQPNTYKCDKCSYATSSSKLLNLHQITHSDSRMYECNVCEFKTKYKKNLCTHLNKHDESKLNSYKCDKCSYATPFRATLKNHQATHLDVRMYECDECEYKAKSQRCLSTHKSIHKDPRYKCNECGFQTKRRSNLRTHQFRHDKLKGPSEVQT